MTLLGAIGAIWIGLWFAERHKIREQNPPTPKRKKGLWDGIL